MTPEDMIKIIQALKEDEFKEMQGIFKVFCDKFSIIPEDIHIFRNNLR